MDLFYENNMKLKQISILITRFHILLNHNTNPYTVTVFDELEVHFLKLK
jgi:hypothetical protein